jgi:hypothetical protein
MLNQGLCCHNRAPNTNAMLEIGPPTAEDVEAAKLRVNETFPPAVPVRGNKRNSEVQLLPIQA